MRPVVSADRLPFAVDCRALVAALKMAYAYYLCPEGPVCDREVWLHVDAYLACLEHEAISGSRYKQLAAVLYYYIAAWKENSGIPPLQCLRLLQRVAGALRQQTELRAATSQQLAQLGAEEAAGQLPTLTQLEVALAKLLLQVSQRSMAEAQQAPPAAQHVAAQQLTETHSACITAAQAWLQLEPNNPQAVVAAASSNLLREDNPPESDELAVSQLLRAVQLAQEQGSPFCAAEAAVAAVVNAMLADTLNRPALQAVLEASQQIGPALEACRRLLPLRWIGQLEARCVLQA